MQGFSEGDTIFQMVDASRFIEVRVEKGEDDRDMQPRYELITKMGNTEINSNANYVGVSHAIADARTVFDLLNGLTGYINLKGV